MLFVRPHPPACVAVWEPVLNSSRKRGGAALLAGHIHVTEKHVAETYMAQVTHHAQVQIIVLVADILPRWSDGSCSQEAAQQASSIFNVSL